MLKPRIYFCFRLQCTYNNVISIKYFHLEIHTRDVFWVTFVNFLG